MLRNLLRGRFGGPVMPVAPDARAVAGVLAYPDVDALPLTPDLALLCDANDSRNASLIEALGRRGTAVAIVMGAVRDRAALRRAAEASGIRLLGARSLGVIVPSARLDASAAHVPAHQGGIAFVSQSGAMCSTILDWAKPRGIGFSHFISLGEGTDVDFGDVLDLLANDDEAKAILLYIENIDERRDFVPAARAAARNKPLLMLKAGRSDADRPIGAFLSESLATHDEVFDALARRTGALRVDHLDELFAAADTLARSPRVRGERLAVLCNGADLGLMASDELALSATAPPAELPDKVFARLASLGQSPAMSGNPLDLGTAAGPTQYAEALAALAEEADPDVVLALHAPTVLADAEAIASAVAQAHERLGGNLLTCWLGGETAQAARRILSQAGLPTYDSLGHAVRGFRHMVDYHRNQTMLLETPPSGLIELREARRLARPAIERALRRPGGFLTDPEVRETLAAYGIAAMQSVLAADPAQAAQAAVRLGFPVALTYASQDVPRKWDVGGVALNLENAEAVEVAAEAMLTRVSVTAPHARFDGFGIQRMALRPHARQLMIGIACDRLFGPVAGLRRRRPGGRSRSRSRPRDAAAQSSARAPADLADPGGAQARRAGCAPRGRPGRDRRRAGRRVGDARRSPGAARLRHQSAVRRRAGRAGGRRPDSRRADRARRSPAGIDPIVSERARGVRRAARRRARRAAPGAPGGRAVARRTGRTDGPGRPAQPVPGQGAPIRSPATRAAHADRLRPRDGVRRDSRSAATVVARRSERFAPWPTRRDASPNSRSWCART